MKTLKRLYTSLSASIEQHVSELENHEAIIRESLKQRREHINLAELRLQQVQEAQGKIAQAIAQQRLNIDDWNRRAQDSGHDNRPLALQCLHRREQCQLKINKLQQAEAQYSSTIEQSQQQLEEAQEQFNSLSRQHELMRLQQCSADSLNVINTPMTDLDSLHQDFERWQIKLSRHSVKPNVRNQNDNLEQQFIQNEKQEALEQELNRMLGLADEDHRKNQGDEGHGY